MKLEVYVLRRDCHNLMDKIWGTHKAGRNLAYAWLREEFGISIHFRYIDDEELLHKIYVKLKTVSITEHQKYLKVNEPSGDWEQWLDHKNKGRRGRNYKPKR